MSMMVENFKLKLLQRPIEVEFCVNVLHCWEIVTCCFKSVDMFVAAISMSVP